jgi:hypothetical protein
LKERHAEEQRRCDEEAMRRQTEEIHLRMQQQDEELRRRHQENSIFMQVIVWLGDLKQGVYQLGLTEGP